MSEISSDTMNLFFCLKTFLIIYRLDFLLFTGYKQILARKAGVQIPSIDPENEPEHNMVPGRLFMESSVLFFSLFGRKL